MNSPKIALITGGSRGLGKNMALALARSGVDSIITYNSNSDAAQEVVTEIQALGRKAVALKFDVGAFVMFDGFLADVRAALQTTWSVNTFDFLINNAGIGGTIPIANVTEADFDTFCNVHFKGVYFLTQKSLPMMNDGGRIINISTGTTRFCVPGYSVYASMKAAVETFTRYLAKEIGARGMTANVLAPGAIETDFNGAAIRTNPQMKAFLASQTALGRVGEANDIGGIAAFLCSDAAYWINAQRIEASGGMFL
jgi:NAD(P)-dependent dehydrogenase (short-subunit alcohol dehydrogenase family)